MTNDLRVMAMVVSNASDTQQLHMLIPDYRVVTPCIAPASRALGDPKTDNDTFQNTDS